VCAVPVGRGGCGALFEELAALGALGTLGTIEAEAGAIATAVESPAAVGGADGVGEMGVDAERVLPATVIVGGVCERPRAKAAAAAPATTIVAAVAMRARERRRGVGLGS